MAIVNFMFTTDFHHGFVIKTSVKNVCKAMPLMQYWCTHEPSNHYDRPCHLIHFRIVELVKSFPPYQYLTNPDNVFPEEKHFSFMPVVAFGLTKKRVTNMAYIFF